MSKQQADLVKLQSKLSTGQDVLKPSDNPLAMSTALNAKEGVAQFDAFKGNLTYVKNTLGQVDVALSAASDVIRTVRDSVMTASNTLISQADRDTIAEDIRGRLDELLGISNRKSTDGNYLFSGVADDVPPFQVAAGVTQPYAGADRGREIQVSDGRKIDLGITGEDAFVDQATGKSIFTTIEDALADMAAGNLNNLRGRLGEIDATFDSVQLSRTKAGLREREAETIDQINFSASNELERIAGEAVGLDYAKAITELSQGQLKLQATQQSFASLGRLSLFNFLN